MKSRLFLYELFILSILSLLVCEKEDVFYISKIESLKNIYVDNAIFLYKGEWPQSPCWFYNGEKIAFIEHNPYNKNGNESWISIIDKNGSNYHSLNKYKEFYDIYDLDVNSDGEWIVFEGKEKSNDGSSDMYLIPSSGGDAIRLYIDGDEYSPRFSNDSQWIYFIGTCYGDGIYKVHIDGKELKQLGVKDSGLYDIDLTADNNFIIYSIFNVYTSKICVYSISEDKSWSVFEKKSNYAISISVSPDGRWICYGNSGLYIIPFEGGDPVQITSRADFYPNWSNDGKWIVFIRDDQSLCKVLVPSEFLPE